jgi:hypothetical protein
MNKEFNLTHFREAQEKRVQEKKIWMLKMVLFTRKGQRLTL